MHHVYELNGRNAGFSKVKSFFKYLDEGKLPLYSDEARLYSLEFNKYVNEYIIESVFIKVT